MKKYRIVFLCHFSNSIIRERLKLKQYKLQNAIGRLCGLRHISYDDFAIWVSDYINEFEKRNDIEFWIVAPHRGMKVEKQTFDINGIHYFFYKCDKNVIYSYLNLKFHLQEKTNYRTNRKRIRTIIENIQPNVIILCGAENPYYSLGILDIKKVPVYVILQTLLNDPKRKEMGVGSPYRRKSELEVFRRARYFNTSGKQAYDIIKRVNSEAVFLPTGFPTHRPAVLIPERKKFDFVFFARDVTKYKGIEDLLTALSIVKKSHNDISLNIIGGIKVEYKKFLEDMIQEMDISENVCFSGYYLQIEKMYENVAKASVVVVPGITAALNSTVRESMLMGLPTICYETTATDGINKEKPCIMTAEMGNINELARQMMLAIENAKQTKLIAANGKEYADRLFSNEAIVKNLLDNCIKIIERREIGK